MKFFMIIVGAMLLASCSSTGTSGASGTNEMGSSEMNKPVSNRVFNPDDPYHGG